MNVQFQCLPKTMNALSAIMNLSIALKKLLKIFLDYKGILKPEIRVSHVIKGRVPTAIGKLAKDLLEQEKTIYYERMAFVIEIPEISEIINGNKLNLTIGGVRSLTIKKIYLVKNQWRNSRFLSDSRTLYAQIWQYQQMDSKKIFG